MIPIPYFAIRFLFAAGLCGIALPLLADPPHSRDAIEALLRELSADSFVTRERAEQLLIMRSADPEIRCQITQRIAADLAAADVTSPREDLEGFLAKKRLRWHLEQQWVDRVLDQFVHDPAFDRDSFAGWSEFRHYAGDNVTSRLLFAELKRRNLIVSPPRDIDSLERCDAASWCLALITACRQEKASACELSFQLASALRCEGSGPLPRREAEQQVLARLIEHFIDQPSVDARDRIVIGLRFGCRQATLRQCHQILSDPSQSPSRIVTALLAVSALEPSTYDIAPWLTRYQNDDRISHTWRSMLPPKSTRRTQVRDVALAIELHRSGIDPRSRGFDALIADPVLVFRPYSLGFESEAARQRAYGGSRMTDVRGTGSGTP